MRITISSEEKYKEIERARMLALYRVIYLMRFLRNIMLFPSSVQLGYNDFD